MVQSLFKLFLISAVCTGLLAMYTFTEGGSGALAAQAQGTPTPFQPGPTFTPIPEAYIGGTIRVRVSHYWPPLGGVNCLNFVNGQCLSRMASGERWQDWKGHAIACPPEFGFGTQILIGERVWVCLDRGGAIQIEDGAVWVDMLIPEPLYDYGEIIEATIIGVE